MSSRPSRSRQGHRAVGRARGAADHPSRTGGRGGTRRTSVCIGAGGSLMTTSELRRIGIAPLRDIAWGTHLCCFVRTTEDLLALVTPYIKAGLESHEYCIWVLSDGLTKNLAAAALRQAIPDLDRHLGQRSLDIVAARDWYLERGRLDRRRVVRNWLHRLGHAEAQGFGGMRAAGAAA